jgi:hypothetical protein
VHEWRLGHPSSIRPSAQAQRRRQPASRLPAVLCQRPGSSSRLVQRPAPRRPAGHARRAHAGRRHQQTSCCCSPAACSPARPLTAGLPGCAAVGYAFATGCCCTNRLLRASASVSSAPLSPSGISSASPLPS